MPLSTYDELKSSIADFLNRDDLTNQIPDFITLAEKRMNREIRHWRMETRSNAVIDSQFSALPVKFLEPIRMSLLTAATQPLEMVGPYEISDLRARNANSVGQPRHFAILDGSIEVEPAPDGNYDLELLYYREIDALTASNTSNWVLEYHPDAYLYGALAHSAPFLQEDQRLQTWEILYQAAVGAINMESEKSKTGGSGRRMKIRSY